MPQARSQIKVFGQAFFKKLAEFEAEPQDLKERRSRDEKPRETGAKGPAFPRRRRQSYGQDYLSIALKIFFAVVYFLVFWFLLDLVFRNTLGALQT